MYRSRRRLVRNLSAIALLASLSACGGDEPLPPLLPLASLPDAPADVVHDLVADLGYADCFDDGAELVIASLADRDHLSAGWAFPGRAKEGGLDEASPLWSDDTYAELRFLFPERAPRRIEAKVRPFKEPDASVASTMLRVSLNGEQIGEMKLKKGWHNLSFELPVEQQRAGVNHIGLAFDHSWQINEVMTESADFRRVSIQLDKVSVTVEDKEIRARSEAAARLLPEHSTVENTGAGAGRSLLQTCRSLVSHHLALPADASLVADLAFVGRSEATTEEALFQAIATTDQGEEVELVSERVRFGVTTTRVEASFGALAGKIARLELRVSGVDVEGQRTSAIVGLWGNLAVTGTSEEAVVAEAPQDLKEAMKGKPVVLFLLDAFNPFFISSYGGRPDLTPNLDRIGAEGALFDAAYAPATYTISSVPSILASVYTWEHGAWNEDTPLAESVATWPARFKASGYRTVGFAHSPNGSTIFDFDRGFETFYDLFKEIPPDRETVLAEKVLEPLEEVLSTDDERPLLLWFHIIEPHEPYEPPAPFLGSLMGEDEGSIEGSSDTLWSIRKRSLKPTPEEIARIKIRYEENIAYIDSVFGTIRERLEQAGIFDDAFVAVFSDHGEGFLEHDGKVFAGMGHGSTVYEEMSRIPLLIRLPSGLAPEGIRPASVASNMDIFPTAAELVGVPTLSEDLRGQSLVQALLDAEAMPRETTLSHTSTMLTKDVFLPALTLRHKQWKYIHTSGDEFELYDLSIDPGEENNLAAELPVQAGYLRQLLRARSSFDIDHGGITVRASGTTELDEETLAKMRALGYTR